MAFKLSKLSKGDIACLLSCAVLSAMGLLFVLVGILGLTGVWQFADPINLTSYSVLLIKAG